MYLSKDSLDAEIVTAKSSEMNILVPKDDGDFVSYLLFALCKQIGILKPFLALQLGHKAEDKYNVFVIMVVQNQSALERLRLKTS